VNIDYPYAIDRTGRTAAIGRDDHVRDMIEEILFCAPGERVNRPDFGCGLLQLVFSPNSPELAAALEITTQAALQRWLADVIDVIALDVVADDSTIRASIDYVVRATGELQSAVIERASP
jgi:phage baseplate assembly protein W